MPLLIETVTGDTMAALRAARDAVRLADLVELRLDGVADVDVAAALSGRSRPAVVTCRPVWEGGRFDGSEEERLRVLAAALEAGADYVDVEWKADAAPLRRLGSGRLVISSHDFGGMPPDLCARAREMRKAGADVVKIAVTPTRLTDTLPLRDLTRDGRTVVIGMGGPGMPTRVLAAQYGSCWTYAGAGAAPGQIPAARMVDEFRFRRIEAGTTVYGVVGRAVMQSRSPAMHNAAFAAAGLNAVFVPLQTDDFGDFLAFAEAMRIAGASVTMPFKRDALEAAVRADEPARRVGAANTLRRGPDGWEATNTDVAGFLAPLGIEDGTDPFRLRGSRVAVLGAGGAARAVVVALESAGARVTVHARRDGQAREVAALARARAASWPPPPGSWDVLVNCTPLGGEAFPDASPLPGGPFGGRLVYDLIYSHDTPLMREARAAGCEVIGGMPMLRAQAERQFRWWTSGDS
jgi:3-dehydroquinate dehydratase/shikimate dehydrogenase